MSTTLYIPALTRLLVSAHIPAISYAYVAPSRIEAVSLGVKSTTDQANIVNDDTIFPASSLSKIVFAYLVLKLIAEDQLSLDQPLHDILPYERFQLTGEYPENAKKLTARHVLSHTTGLPNWAPDFHQNPDAALKFNFKPEEELGSGYYYSGEAFLYLQKAIEKLMGQDLEALAKQYVFASIGMTRSSYKQANPNEKNIVKVHTQYGNPKDLYQDLTEQNSAGSLITTASDFSKFMNAWLGHMDDPIMRQAFEPVRAGGRFVCGLGWHIHNGIAWQHGANDNTKSFVAINIKDRTGVVFFTNSENGMSIVNQILTGVNGLPLIGDMSKVLSVLGYSQSDEPGWEETLKGRIAEEREMLDDAKKYYIAANEAVGTQDSEQYRRLIWFNSAEYFSQTRSEFKTSLESFTGYYAYGGKVFVKDDKLMLATDRTDKLVRISENEFVPERDQIFKIRFEDGKMNVLFLHEKVEIFLEKVSDLELVERPVTHLRDAKIVQIIIQPAMSFSDVYFKMPDILREQIKAVFLAHSEKLRDGDIGSTIRGIRQLYLNYHPDKHDGVKQPGFDELQTIIEKLRRAESSTAQAEILQILDKPSNPRPKSPNF